MKKCPYCGELIQNQAKKCRYCGEWLVPHQNYFQKHKKTFIIIFILFVAFIILFIHGQYKINETNRIQEEMRYDMQNNARRDYYEIQSIKDKYKDIYKESN